MTEDRLQIDDSNWSGTRTVEQVLADFGSRAGNDLLIDFGGGNEILLEGINDSSALAAVIDII